MHSNAQHLVVGESIAFNGSQFTARSGARAVLPIGFSSSTDATFTSSEATVQKYRETSKRPVPAANKAGANARTFAPATPAFLRPFPDPDNPKFRGLTYQLSSSYYLRIADDKQQKSQNAPCSTRCISGPSL